MEYADQVLMITVQKRVFNWTMPHQPLNNNQGAMGTAFYMRYKKKIHLITCFHVIENSFHIAASSPSLGSKEYPCRVIWICPEMDLAVLEIKKDEQDITQNPLLNPTRALSPIRFPQTNRHKIHAPEIGAPTFTIGYPLGQTHLKMTKGILSGQQLGLYQTDAPINGGNSGGPLLWKNKVLGINSRGYTLAQSVGYAIPVMNLLHLIDFHECHPDIYHIRFPRNWGLRLSPPSSLLFPSSLKDKKKKNGNCTITNNKSCGIEIRGVYHDQLMAGTSLRRGDILLSVDGHPISAMGELPLEWLNQKMTFHSLLLHMPLGREVPIEYLSRGRERRREIIRILPESSKIHYRKWYEEHEDIPYLYLAGIVMVPFTQSYMDQRYKFLREPEFFRIENPFLFDTLTTDDPTLLKLTDPSEWNRGRIMISNVLKSSLVEETHILKVGEIVDMIGGRKVPTIRDAIRIIRALLAEKKDVDLTLLSGSVLHIPFSTLIQQEKELGAIYQYESSLQDLFE